MPRPILLGIAGSLRSQANSRAILDSIFEMLPADVAHTTLDIGELPHYDAELEAHGLPASVSDARDRVQTAAAVVITVPEYNHGMPGVLKNALDWLSRPVRASAMLGKPVFFVTQSNGALGGVRAQHAMRETLASMLCELPPMPEIAVTFVGEKVRDGRLVDEPTLHFIRTQLEYFLARYVVSGLPA
jgi:chromate reductase, NAD(P)H dehydrogenase (quinone)